MGHYLTEMMCNTYGHRLCRCRCRRKPTKEDLSLLLNENFDIVPAKSARTMVGLYWPLYASIDNAKSARAEAIRLGLAVADGQLRLAISVHRKEILKLIDATKRSPKVTDV